MRATGEEPSGSGPPPMALGVSVPEGPRFASDLAEFADAARRPVTVVSTYEGWAYDTFDTGAARRLHEQGMSLMVTWEPWDYLAGLDQPGYRLRNIAAGHHDRYATEFLHRIAELEVPVLIRFAHEMNGSWYPWSIGLEGNTAGDYVAAWRHLVTLARAVGATNAQWVWSPNVGRGTDSPLTATWPGPEWVDWIGLSGYNAGTALPWGGWQTFDQIFSSSLDAVGRLGGGRIPVMIAEIGCAEDGGDKATWITGMFATIHRRNDVQALVWFNRDAQADWRIATSPGSIAAFGTGIARFAPPPAEWLRAGMR